MNKCFELHKLFNGMKRYNYKTIKDIPFNNGVYIFFGENQKYKGMDRIIRVGTDRKQNKLKKRMRQHFLTPHKDGSIFRKNIGRAILNKQGNNELLKYWNQDKDKKETELNIKCDEIETQITNYICENMEFVVFNLETEKERLRFEEAIISTLYHSQDFEASKEWLGNFVPTTIKNNHVVDSRMWVSQGINADEISDEEFEKLKTICSLYN